MGTPVNFYADFKGLASLKKDATVQDPKALREAARQFESLFTQMMLKSMRDANHSFRSADSPTDSDQTDFYREMFDKQMASQMSKGKGLGLSDMLVKQLRNIATPESAGADGKVAKAGGLTLGHTPPTNAPISRTSVSTTASLQHAPPSNAPIAAKPTPVASASLEGAISQANATKAEDGSVTVWCGESPDVSAVPVTDPSNLSLAALQIARAREASMEQATGVGSQSDPTNRESRITTHETSSVEASATADRTTISTSPSDFVSQLWPHAKAAADELGVDPRMLIAHAALETGWGKSIPCNPDGTCSFNLFGIKTGSRWQGPAVGVNTLEFEDGVAVRKQASFRAYDSPAESFRDYATLIKNSPRYAAALGTGNNAAAFATALQQGGYATDPNYANKLTAVAERLRMPFKTDPSQPLASGRRVSTGSGGET